VDGRPRRLTLLNAHLETVSAPRSLWFFRNPRPSQARALLAFLGRHGPGRRDHAAGAVLGGDFNTVQYGAGEPAYGGARAWSSSLGSEDTRDTHAMGRLDYLFFRITARWRAATRRLDERFGSDLPVWPLTADHQIAPSGRGGGHAGESVRDRPTRRKSQPRPDSSPRRCRMLLALVLRGCARDASLKVGCRGGRPRPGVEPRRTRRLPCRGSLFTEIIGLMGDVVPGALRRRRDPLRRAGRRAPLVIW
jgi:hypothetical protein